MHFMVLMSDFVSNWFKNYSTYLAGERREQTSNVIENIVLSVWENKIGRTIVGLLSEGFFLYEFIDFNFAEFLNIVAFLPLKAASVEGETFLTDLANLQDLLQWNGCQLTSEYLLVILHTAVLYRFLVATIELKMGMSRIICLDIEEITVKRAEEAKAQKQK